MLRITDQITIADWEMTESFTRASGPGGQNANKVATEVELRVNVFRLGLAPAVFARLKALAGKSPFVDIVADPADLAPLYRAADMVLLPLSEGGGSRIKVLEALAVGVPVVATAKAVEGLDLHPGRHYLAAETPRDFAAAAERLVREPDLGEQLREEGRAFVQAAHGQDAITGNVRAALAALAHS